MAVYTRPHAAQMQEFISRYALGKWHGMRDILAGVENSNFFLDTDAGTFILTLYEKRVREDDLPFFIGLMRHLATRGIPCPQPIADKNGEVLQTLAEKKAALVSFLKGSETKYITVQHCMQVGSTLASMHKACADFNGQRANALSLEGWKKLGSACAAKADNVAPQLSALIKDELNLLSANWPQPKTLPWGVIHADLFPDNVFFEDDKLCGLIDFYFACNDFLAYDLAICVNAWCFSPASVFERGQAIAMIRAYEAIRPFNEDEKKYFPTLLRGAALRFMLTRLYDLLNHPEGALVKPKDPLEYRAKLLFFREQNPTFFS